jgi:hypothetical protein
MEALLGLVEPVERFLNFGFGLMRRLNLAFLHFIYSG